MSRDWTEKELKIASEQMGKMGFLSYEEFCEKLNDGEFLMPDDLTRLFAVNEDIVSSADRTAMMLYPYIRKLVISHGRAAQLLGIRKWELIEIYARYGIAYCDYEESELEDEVAYYQKMKEQETQRNSE